MLDAVSIRVVLEAYRPERSALLGLLNGLSPGDFGCSTECPEYTVKGVATHILGDDLSLLSRQRDGAEQGLSILSPELPDADFRTLLNTFNDRWVAAAGYLSAELLIELHRREFGGSRNCPAVSVAGMLSRPTTVTAFH